MDTLTLQILSHWKAHNGVLNNLIFSRDGRLLLSSAADGTARLWGQLGALGLPVGELSAVSCQAAGIPLTSTPITPTVTFTPQTPTITPTLLPFYRTLSLNDPVLNGNDVLQLQKRLVALGYSNAGIPDGAFGSKTDLAVRSFQERNQLVVDGIVGPITWNLLFSDAANSNK